MTSSPSHKESLGLSVFNENPGKISGGDDEVGDGVCPVSLLLLHPVTTYGDSVLDVGVTFLRLADT